MNVVRKKRDSTQRVSKIAQYFLWTSFIGVFVISTVIYAGHAMLIDLMYYLSYVKLVISLIKYVPQVGKWLQYLKCFDRQQVFIMYSVNRCGLIFVESQRLDGAYTTFYWIVQVVCFP